MSIGHSGNVHVVFSHAMSYYFPSAQLWFCSSHNPTSKIFEKFFPTNLNFALQFSKSRFSQLTLNECMWYRQRKHL